MQIRERLCRKSIGLLQLLLGVVHGVFDGFA
jgi:hypothetical protein